MTIICYNNDGNNYNKNDFIFEDTYVQYGLYLKYEKAHTS